MDFALRFLAVYPASKVGLALQLKSEGFANEPVAYVLSSINADWDALAVKAAKNYLAATEYSRSALIQVLQNDGFSAEEAEQAARALGF